MYILGIETSCDDTAAALVTQRGGRFVVERSCVSSQIDIHKIYGGVVPEIAGRKHADSIIPVIREALGNTRPDAIAVTAGPGLVTSLVVGVEAARALSYAWGGVPIVRTNHIEGHIYSTLLGDTAPTEIIFPAMALIVSGGHTELILMRGHGDYTLIGRTRDDAVGECFDKAAKVMGLEYPGGPKISKLALEGKRDAIAFPRPMKTSDDFDFSFAGLKTSVLYYLRDNPTANHADVCASFEQAVTDVLVAKTVRAAQEYNAASVILSGGVSANRYLREGLRAALVRELPECAVLIPELQYTTDNAAMIAAAGWFHAQNKDYTPWSAITADPAWELVN